eukprot:9742110-Alexandrium_andersonii.AAC.1
MSSEGAIVPVPAAAAGPGTPTGSQGCSPTDPSKFDGQGLEAMIDGGGKNPKPLGGGGKIK